MTYVWHIHSCDGSSGKRRSSQTCRCANCADRPRFSSCETIKCGLRPKHIVAHVAPRDEWAASAFVPSCTFCDRTSCENTPTAAFGKTAQWPSICRVSGCARNTADAVKDV